MDSYQTFTIKEIRKENQRTSTLVFNKAIQPAYPGQFMMVWLPDVGEKPFSIANDDPFTITVAAVGSVSRTLCTLQPGKRVWVRGPLGHGFALHGKRHLLVGGGYGAAPLHYLAKLAIARGEIVHVCLGAVKKEELLLQAAFIETGCDVLVSTEDGSCGDQGLVTKLVEKVVDDFQPDTLYACGPRPMLVALAQFCREKTLPAQLSWETILRCGIGLCGVCELDPEVGRILDIPSGWLTCKDGPVSRHIFDIENLYP